MQCPYTSRYTLCHRIISYWIIFYLANLIGKVIIPNKSLSLRINWFEMDTYIRIITEPLFVFAF